MASIKRKRHKELIVNQLYQLSPQEIQSRPTQRKGTSSLSQNSNFEMLVMLIRYRLSFMKDVAAYKWEHQIAIEDVQREKVVIENSLQNAKAHRLDGDSIRMFFTTQITLAKVIEQYWFDEWQTEGFNSFDYADLSTIIRPVLISSGNDILKAIKACKLWHNTRHKNLELLPIFCNKLEMTGISLHEKHQLFKTLLAIKPLA